MSPEEFDDLQPEERPSENKGGNPLVLIGTFVFGIFLMITLLYFAY